jgi:hypothetical protein
VFAGLGRLFSGLFGGCEVGRSPRWRGARRPSDLRVEWQVRPASTSAGR